MKTNIHQNEIKIMGFFKCSIFLPMAHKIVVLKSVSSFFLNEVLLRRSFYSKISHFLESALIHTSLKYKHLKIHWKNLLKA